MLPQAHNLDRTHFDGCEEVHPECKIAKLEKENAQLRAENTETRRVLVQCYQVINRRDGWDSAVDDAWQCAKNILAKYPKEQK